MINKTSLDFSSVMLFMPGIRLYSKRSTKGITRLSPTERSAIEIPNEIKEILVGILLGDAHINKRSVTGNARLVYSQTAEKHKEYF
jgi:hypothetical protein